MRQSASRHNSSSIRATRTTWSFHPVRGHSIRFAIPTPASHPVFVIIPLGNPATPPFPFSKPAPAIRSSSVWVKPDRIIRSFPSCPNSITPFWVKQDKASRQLGQWRPTLGYNRTGIWVIQDGDLGRTGHIEPRSTPLWVNPDRESGSNRVMNTGSGYNRVTNTLCFAANLPGYTQISGNTQNGHINSPSPNAEMPGHRLISTTGHLSDHIPLRFHTVLLHRPTSLRGRTFRCSRSTRCAWRCGRT